MACAGAFAIGGQTVGFESSVEIAWPSAFASFATAAPPDLVVDVERSVPTRPSSPASFSTGGLWELREEPSNRHWLFDSPVHGLAPFASMTLERGGARAKLQLHPQVFSADRPLTGLDYPMLELLWQSRLADAGAVSLHAAAVMTERGEGLLFVAPSGGGKTTISGLCARSGRLRVLSDERTILTRSSDGSFWVYGTPWHGEGRQAFPGPARLKAVLFLGKGPNHICTPLPPSAALSRLIVASFLAYHSRSVVTRLLSALHDVVARVPMDHLDFAPHSSVVSFLLRRYVL